MTNMKMAYFHDGIQVLRASIQEETMREVTAKFQLSKPSDTISRDTVDPWELQMYLFHDCYHIYKIGFIIKYHSIAKRC